MKHTSHMVGSDFPAVSIDLNLASGSHAPHIAVNNYEDAIVLTLGLPGTTVVCHLTAESAAALARELTQATSTTSSE